MSRTEVDSCGEDLALGCATPELLTLENSVLRSQHRCEYRLDPFRYWRWFGEIGSRSPLRLALSLTSSGEGRLIESGRGIPDSVARRVILWPC